MPPPPSVPAPPKKTNWVLIGCGGCLTLIVLGALGFGGIFYGVMKVIKSTDPYKTALAAARNSPEVQEELGTPIETGFLVTGSVNSNSGGETADLTIPLKGPKGSASVHYAATKHDSTWEVSDFTVTVDGSNKKIPLTP